MQSEVNLHKLAARLISHGAASREVKTCCVGLSDAEIKRITIQVRGEPPRSGKSPSGVYWHLNSVNHRYESSIFASYAFVAGLIDDVAVATPDGGMLLCAAYERFVDDVKTAEMGIRRAMNMVGLLRSGEMLFEKCTAPNCYGVYVTAPNEHGSKCPHCAITEEAQAKKVAQEVAREPSNAGLAAPTLQATA